MHLIYCVFQVSKPNWIRLSYPTDPQRRAGRMAVGTRGAGDEIAPPDFGRKRNADSSADETGDTGVKIAPPFGRKRKADSRADGTGGAGAENDPLNFGRKRNPDTRADGTGGTGGEIAPPFGRKRSKSCSIRIFTITACPLKLVFYELSHFCHFAVGFFLHFRIIFAILSSTFEMVY